MKLKDLEDFDPNEWTRSESTMTGEYTCPHTGETNIFSCPECGEANIRNFLWHNTADDAVMCDTCKEVFSVL